VVLEGHTLINDLPPDCPPALSTLLAECWQKEASKRPEMKDILERWAGKSPNDSAEPIQRQAPIYVKYL
jgi:hypothetical protein